MANNDNLSELKIVKNKENGIFLFCGGDTFGGIQRQDILNSLVEKFENCDVYVYVDKIGNCFHSGIKGITTDIKTTTEYLRILVSKYKKVIFSGATGIGGYGAILYGSKLNIPVIITFMPITIIEKAESLNSKYVDLKTIISAKSKYHIYVDEINGKHTTNIEEFANVFVNKYENLSVGQLYNSGELYKIIGKYMPDQKRKCCC